MRYTTLDLPGLKLVEVADTRDEAVYVVSLNDHEVGKVAFIKYYKRVAEALEPYIALWAGPTLCVIDRQDYTMRCVDRDDETHRIHAFEGAWIVEGELNVDLFDPQSATTMTTYRHSEVITGSSIVDGLVRVEDFAGATVTLDPRRSLRLAGRGSTSDKSDKR